MSRRLSLAYLTVNGVTLPEHVEVAAECRFHSVGLRLLDNRDPSAEQWRNTDQIEETRKRLDATGVSVLDGEIFWLLPDTRVTDYTGLFEAMQRLDARLLLVLSRDPDASRSFDTFCDLCALAQKYEIMPCLEFSRITPIASLHQAVDVVQRSGAPNARVLVDALHLSRSGGTPADVASADPALFEYAQVCDAPAHVPEDDQRLRQEPSDRLLPGQGGLPLVDLVHALPPDLPLAIEAPVKQMEFLPPAERAWMAMEGLKSVLENAEAGA
jgi:sugar phosphate isomerase/epimerase